MQHGYKTQHSTVTALHTLNNTVAKGFNQMAPPARTITVALDMSKPFDTINIHTLIRGLLQTNIPGTIIEFIANCIKGHKAYTTYRNHTSKQRQFKTGVPQGGVLSPTLFDIYTSGLPPPSARVQVMAYADDITIASTHTGASAARKYIQPYLHKVFAWTKQNNLLLNPGKTTCTLFTPDPAEYTSSLDLTVNSKALPMATHPKVLGLTLDPKLTYSTRIHNISVQARKPLQIIKALTATGWGRQKETLMATYKAVMRPALEYASSVWSPIASSTSINKLQVMQNAALRTATGCTQDTNIQHLHDETLTLPMREHLQLHASQCNRINTEPVPAEILEKMRARDDLRSRDPTSPALQQMNDEITRTTNEHRRNTWRQFVETLDHRTDPSKLWRTIKANHRQRLRTKPSLLVTFKYLPQSRLPNISTDSSPHQSLADTPLPVRPG